MIDREELNRKALTRAYVESCRENCCECSGTCSGCEPVPCECGEWMCDECTPTIRSVVAASEGAVHFVGALPIMGVDPHTLAAGITGLADVHAWAVAQAEELAYFSVRVYPMTEKDGEQLLAVWLVDCRKANTEGTND